MDPRSLAGTTTGERRGSFPVSGTWVVRLPTWLGDTIMALPALRAAARQADAPLLLWGPPGRDELLRHGGLAFDYLPYRRRPGVAGIADAVAATRTLRQRRPGAALLLPNAFEPALLTRAAGIPRRVGFPTDGRSALLTDRVAEPTPRHAVHEADRFACLAAHLGWQPESADHLLQATPELAARAAEMLPNDVAYLGLVAGSANAPAKRWPTAAYAQLAALAQRHWGATTVLLGADADRDINAAIAGRASAEVVDLSGCSLTDLAAALLRCRIVVSNDTGAAHVAAALGRPTAVVFGPTDPARSGPRGVSVLHLSARLFCQPCGYGRCPLEHACMTDLTVENAFESLQPFWQRAA